jgi:uncharacterized repeat protein (TIGR02543 family)
MPESSVILTANFESATHTISITGGTANLAQAVQGANVTISSNVPAGYRFTGWTATGVTLNNPGSANTSFVMPDNPVSLTANFEREPQEEVNEQ